MGSLEILKLCAAIICAFDRTKPQREFEVLAYEQACRTLEVVLRDFLQVWESDTNELESYQR